MAVLVWPVRQPAPGPMAPDVRTQMGESGSTVSGRASAMWKRRRHRTRTRRSHAERAYEKVLDWQQCPTCSYDITTGEGERACHWYACPYLPEDLDVFCPRCNYDFYTGEGAPECHDPPTCRYSRQVAPRHVVAVDQWLARQEDTGGEGPS